MSSLVIPNVKKIAVLRANALGDFFFAYPALCAIRETYKDAEIVYLGKPWHKEFLESRESPINRVIVIPPTRGIREEKGAAYNQELLIKFFNDMKKERFDIAVQMHGGGGYSNPFINGLGAQITAGLRSTDAEPLQKNILYDLYQNEFAKYLEVVELIGAKPKKLFPLLSVTDQDIAGAKRYISSKPFIVLHPGASDKRRRWPTKYFAEVGDFFAQKGYDIVITGTHPEKSLIEEVLDSMDERAINLCNILSLSSLTGIFSLAALVVSNDTGPLHLADALGVKTVGIYWVGNAISSSPIIRTHKKVLFSWNLLCPICKANCTEKNCKHQVSFVESIKPERVIEAAYQLLEND